MSVKLPIKVIPGSSRNCIAGWLGDTLRVRVTASPERGKANAAVESLLSETLGLPRGGNCFRWLVTPKDNRDSRPFGV